MYNMYIQDAYYNYTHNNDNGSTVYERSVIALPLKAIGVG